MKVHLSVIVSLLILNATAQVRHGVSFSGGLVLSNYHSQVKGGRSYFSIMPFQGQADYVRLSDQSIWVGGGLGFCVRQVPFYRYSDRQMTGLQTVEYSGKLKAGLKIQKDRHAFLPFIAIGAGHFAHSESFNKNGVSVFTYTNLKDAEKLIQPIHPFSELGLEFYEGDLGGDKLNFFLRLTGRAYPLNIFSAVYRYEYEPFKYKEIQYRIMEFNLTAGILINR